MKTTLIKFLTYLLIWVIVLSCSTIPDQALIRSPAATDLTCKEIASAIISPQKNVTATTKNLNIPFSLPDVSLNKVIKSRKSLKERYAKFTESIRDFEVHPDLPINGKTKLLLDPREGYLAKIMLIRNAKETIDLSYYIFKSDDTGNAILHELRMAIKRGVKVRILVDSSGSISKAPFYNDIKALISLSGKPILDENGVPTGELAKAEAVLFNPLFNVRAHVANWMKAAYNLFVSSEEKLPLATFTINRRSHDKILLIDSHSETNSMAIIGGRNIADRYYEIGEGEKNPILDAEILIKGFTHKNQDGTTQNALENHYNKIYYYMANKNFEDFLFKTNRNRIRKEFKDMRNSAQHLFDENSSLGDQLKVMEEESFLENGFEDGLISILNEIQNLSRTKIFLKPNGPQNKVNGNSLIKKMHDQISKAEKTVDIITPYFWVPEEEVEYIISWAMKNPERKVRIFSNSLTTTDNIVAQSVVDATFEKKIIEKN